MWERVRYENNPWGGVWVLCDSECGLVVINLTHFFKGSQNHFFPFFNIKAVYNVNDRRWVVSVCAFIIS
jgi:hypothetical protein